MGFWDVTLSLMLGLKYTCLIFALTLVLALPLGLVIAFGSMSKFKPLAYVVKTFKHSIFADVVARIHQCSDGME